MVVVDIDHPDIGEFIRWKVVEEQKVAALVAGSRLANKHLSEIMNACADTELELSHQDHSIVLIELISDFHYIVYLITSGNKIHIAENISKQDL